MDVGMGKYPRSFAQRLLVVKKRDAAANGQFFQLGKAFMRGGAHLELRWLDKPRLLPVRTNPYRDAPLLTNTGNGLGNPRPTAPPALKQGWWDLSHPLPLSTPPLLQPSCPSTQCSA